MMKTALKYLEQVIDIRQKKKVRHLMKDIIALEFFAMLSGADEWVAYEIFGKEHEEFLRGYLELPYGIPSHDTLQRVFAIIPPEHLQGFQVAWNEMLHTDEGEKIKKILAIDGKSQRGNGNKNQKANHIVTAVDENGLSIGEKLVQGKSKEITAIPELLEELSVKGHIITTDAMGSQKDIAKLIRQKRGDYVLALKGNHPELHESVQDYFENPELLSTCAYKSTKEKARGGLEKREYWQTDDIGWLPNKKEWVGLKSIAMTKNTIVKDNKETVDTRYFINSLPLDVDGVARAIRGHWMVESCHWHLDMTFKEDGSHTLEKQAAYNQNILRKLALNVLKVFNIGKKKLSVRMKRFSIGTNPEKHLEALLGE